MKLSTRLGALAAGAVLAGSVVAASSASAGVVPTPTPTHTFPTPPPNPQPRTLPWTFDFQESQIGNVSVNDAQGVGALIMNAWRNDDNLNNPNLTRFLDGAGDSILLAHPSIPQGDVQVDLGTCTITAEQHDFFRIISGTGTGAGLSTPTPGRFTLQALVSLPFVQRGHKVWSGTMDNWNWNRPGVTPQVCPLGGLSLGQIVWALNHGLQFGGVRPSSFDFTVQGHANVQRRVNIHPWATPSQPVTWDSPADTVAPTTS